MGKLLKSISEEEFKDRVKIRFNNILDGLDLYSNGTLEDKNTDESFENVESSFIGFFEDALDLNEEVVIDFYIKKLDEESKVRLLKFLEGEDREILKRHIDEMDNMKSVYFTLDSKELMRFITRLNTKELFFCTVYFEKYEMTIWGNYKLSFPVFFKEESVLKKYEKIAKNNNLEIREVVIR